jgi:hypothetical protein
MNLLRETRTLGDPSPGFGHPPELPTPDGCPHAVSLRLHVNMKKKWGVVQLVGHLTVNEDGEGSNPSAPANFPFRIAAKLGSADFNTDSDTRKLLKFSLDAVSLKDGRIRGSQDTASVPVYFPDCHVFQAFFLNSSNSGAGLPDCDFLALAIIGAEL